MVREILKDEIGFDGFVVSDYENVLTDSKSAACFSGTGSLDGGIQ